MNKIEQTYIISAPVSKVWQALTDPTIIKQWGGGPAKMEAKVGFEFSLWGGDIYGKNTKVVTEKELVQEWQEKGWEKPSHVRFELSEKNGKTELKLIHTDIPPEEFDDIADGWKTYYLGPLKDLLE